MSIDFATIDFAKGGGLVPAIIQDFQSEQVLMLGYMNEDALETTQKTGRVTFFSRSKGRLWTKGETSGHHLTLKSIQIDCDCDTILIKAEPAGPTCHLGSPSCFGDDIPKGLGFLSFLEALIMSRKLEKSNNSYTAQLLASPLNKIAQKVGEEGVETALAAVAEKDERLVSEAADLIYHLLVLLSAKDIRMSEVISELRSRHGDA